MPLNGQSPCQPPVVRREALDVEPAGVVRVSSRQCTARRGDNPGMTPARPALILASTSRYRRELLERLRLPFAVQAPDVDESPLAGEAPAATRAAGWRWPRRAPWRRSIPTRW